MSAKRIGSNVKLIDSKRWVPAPLPPWELDDSHLKNAITYAQRRLRSLTREQEGRQQLEQDEQ
jgi:hypothetical protein